jgi:hypothetical protein
MTNIIPFRSPSIVAGTASLRCVEDLTVRLAAGLRSHDPKFTPLRLRLDELSGVDDPTIRRLSALANAGRVSHATAARLALRHATETGARRPLDDLGRDARRRFVTVVGRAPHDFCLRIEIPGDRFTVSVATAPVWCRDRVVESGLRARAAVCVFTGRELDGSPTFATVGTSNWRPTVLRLTGTPTFAFATRVHLISWSDVGLPRIRSAVVDELGRQIAAQAHAHRIAGRQSRMRRPLGEAATIASMALLLIAATCPDLFDGDRP